MKKRLLITSIVMMLVVAVALSTATYAWFTSNDSVTASTVTMTAATNDQAALGISWTDGNYGTSIAPEITLATADSSFVFSPVTPATLSKTGTITDSTVAFTTAFAHSVNGDFIFNSNGNSATHGAYVWTDGDGHTSFFVKNTSPSNALVGNLTLKATIGGEGAGLIRVGVFKYNSTSTKYELIEVLANEDDYTYTTVAANTTLATGTTYYKKVLGQYVEAVAGDATAVTGGVADYVADTTQTTAVDQFYTRSNDDTNAKAVYGSIVKDASVNAMATYTCATSVNVETNLAANTAVELKIIAWMDGAALGDAQAGRNVTIALTFDVE